MSKEIEFHPAAMLVPMISGDEYEQLKADIAANGQLEPIWLHPDGRILDGRNRYVACRELGIEPRFRRWDGDSEVSFVISLNIHRRHLTSGQRAAIAADVLPVLEAEARARQATSTGGAAPQLKEKIPEAGTGQSRDLAAGILRTNGRYVQEARNIQRDAPALFDAVRSGEMTIPQARRQMAAEARATTRREAAGASDVTLYQADALEFIPALGNGSVALVIADPPYNVTDHAWDRVGTEREYLFWTATWLEALRPKLAAGYHLFLFCDPAWAARMEAVLEATRYELRSRMIWEYRNLVKGRDVRDRFITNWQMLFHCGAGPLNLPDEWDDRRFAVQNHARPQSNFDEGSHHPTPKPVSLLRTLVEFGSRPGDVVLDPFAGGGSTGQACVETGDRRCVLVEREATFCRAIEDRLGVTARGLR